MKKLMAFIGVLLAATCLLACESESVAPNEEVAVAAQDIDKTAYLAGHHVSNQVACSSCHSGGFTLDDNESVQNAACTNCHGSLTDLAARGSQAINAHDSHLGQINCTTCHRAHTASQPYCSNCHLFNMSIPFQGIPSLPAPPAETEPVIEDEADVVVIGSGGAGLSAAITAHDQGAKVIVLEKQPLTGGNTMLAAGGMNAANTRFQRALGISDTVQTMFTDTMTAGQNLNDPRLVHILSANSAGSVDWLTSLGVDLSDVGKLAGSSVARSHRPRGGLAVGAHLIDVLRNNVQLRQIDVRVNSKVVKLVEDSRGTVVGVHVLGKHKGLYAIEAKAVVLAAGGFSANPARVASYRPDYEGMSTSNQPGATGDGLDLGVAIQGKLVDMAQIQIHPTLAAGSRILITEAVRGNGGILVNREGVRFVNEMTTRNAVSATVLAQTGKTAFLVFDQTVRQNLAQSQGYFELGLVTEGNTIEELATAIGVPAGALVATIARYNQAYSTASNQLDPDFQRPIPHPIDAPKYYAIEVKPGVHYTMGGLKINQRTQVISTDGSTIDGFYAVGEVTGGVHGADRLGGNSISETITFGRIAGANAAARAQKPCGSTEHHHPHGHRHHGRGHARHGHGQGH
ncbi:MAG: flavocytochrome c [Myxococcales bacterium]